MCPWQQCSEDQRYTFPSLSLNDQSNSVGGVPRLTRSAPTNSFKKAPFISLRFACVDAHHLYVSSCASTLRAPFQHSLNTDNDKQDAWLQSVSYIQRPFRTRGRRIVQKGISHNGNHLPEVFLTQSPSPTRTHLIFLFAQLCCPTAQLVCSV